jgi:hypothetical protein
MTRNWLAYATAVLLMPGVAAAQEGVGAERIEIGSAIFGGGLLVTPSADSSASATRSYVISGAFTVNVNPRFGLEGDLGVALGNRQTHDLYGVLPPDPDRSRPNVLIFSGNVIYNPLSSERKVVPYISFGAGALRTFALAEGSQFGLHGQTIYPTGSIGGGVRWFPIRHWGFRGDYRYLGIYRNNENPSAGAARVRSAHRLYGALVMTFGG